MAHLRLILRSIRRRDVISSPLSVYTLARNAKPSWGSSYNGQNSASLCRALGSKPVVTGFGSNNTSNAIRELARKAQPSWGSSYTRPNYASLCRAFGSKPVVTGLGSNNTSNAIREQSKAAIVGALPKATIDAAPGGGGTHDQAYEKVKNKAREYWKILVEWLLELLYELYRASRVRIVTVIVAMAGWYFWRDRIPNYEYDLKTVQNKVLDVEVKNLQKELDDVKMQLNDVKMQLNDVKMQLNDVKGDVKSRLRGFSFFF